MLKMRNSRSRRGFALLLVVVSTSAMLSAWSLASRQVAELVRRKESLKLREETSLARADRCRLMALGYALAMLETGSPPADPSQDDPYRCNVSIGLPGQDSLSYTLTFVRVEGSDEWSVNAAPTVDHLLPGPGAFTFP